MSIRGVLFRCASTIKIPTKHVGLVQADIRPKKKICVFTVTCQKNLGSVGRDYYYYFFFIIGKTGNSRSRFRNPIPVFNFRRFR